MNWKSQTCHKHSIFIYTSRNKLSFQCFPSLLSAGQPHRDEVARGHSARPRLRVQWRQPSGQWSGAWCRLKCWRRLVLWFAQQQGLLYKYALGLLLEFRYEELAIFCNLAFGNDRLADIFFRSWNRKKVPLCRVQHMICLLYNVWSLRLWFKDVYSLRSDFTWWLTFYLLLKWQHPYIC